MNTELNHLLTRLEELSSEIADRSDPSLHENVDILEVRELIRERGKLIEQLQPMLAANTALSYEEWNRLVVLHHQGARIHENIERSRNRLVIDLSVNCSGRVFLDRITGLLK